MNRVAKNILVMAPVLFLGGCVGTQLEQAQRVSPEGSAFNVSLYQEYIDLSSSEYNEGDYRDSDNFAVRAMQSGTGGTVAPEEIGARRLPDTLEPASGNPTHTLADFFPNLSVLTVPITMRFGR